MATKTYTQSERGGGNGDTGRMRAAILNQINSWWRQAVWVDEDKADRLHAKLNETPERFISPNPDANYREEASRIYSELKDDYTLRQETDLSGLTNEYEERAEAHYQRQRQEPEPIPESELGGAPEPTEPTADTGRDPFAEPAPFETQYPGYLGLVRLFTDYTAELAKARVTAVFGVLSALWLALTATVESIEATGRDRAYTLKVYGEYGRRRLTQEAPDSGRIAAEPYTGQ